MDILSSVVSPALLAIVASMKRGGRGSGRGGNNGNRGNGKCGGKGGGNTNSGDKSGKTENPPLNEKGMPSVAQGAAPSS